MDNHGNILLRFFYRLNEEEGMDVVQIGKALVRNGADELFTGGFWIWDIHNNIEYYSPKFFMSLGYGYEELPHVPQTWMDLINEADMDIAIENFGKHVDSGGEHPYHQTVEYTTKTGKKIKLICSGSLVKEDGEQLALIGTHALL